MPLLIDFMVLCQESFTGNIEIKLVSTTLHLLTEETVCPSDCSHFLNVTALIYIDSELAILVLS